MPFIFFAGKCSLLAIVQQLAKSKKTDEAEPNGDDDTYFMATNDNF